MLRVWANVPMVSGLGTAGLLDVVQQPNTTNLVLQVIISVVGLVTTLLGHRKVNQLVKEQRKSQTDTTIVNNQNTNQ